MYRQGKDIHEVQTEVRPISSSLEENGPNWLGGEKSTTGKKYTPGST